jgi:hypothetical protein
LIETEPQEVAGIVVETSGSEAIDPKIQKRQVADNPVEKFGDKGAIRRCQIA